MTEQERTTKPRKEEWGRKKDLPPETPRRKKTEDEGLFQDSALVLVIYGQLHRPNGW